MSSMIGVEGRGHRMAGLRSLPLGIRVGIAMGLAALVLPLIGARWAAEEARDTVQREALDGQSAVIAAMLSRLDVAYDTAVRGATSAAERPGLTAAVATGNAAAAVVVLHNVRELGFFRQVAVYDRTGALLGSDPQGAPSRYEQPVPDAPAISAPSAGPSGVVVLVRAAFRSNGEKVGQLVAEISFPSLMGGQGGLRLPAGVDVTIVDSDATILASPLGDRVEGQRILAPEALALIHHGRRGTAEYFAPRFGYDVIGTFVPGTDRPWSALATSRRSRVFAESDELDRRLKAGGLLLAGLLLAIASLVARYVGAAERRLGRARADVAEHNESLAAHAAELSNAVERLDVEVAARRQLIDTATDAFVSMDESGAITGWNRQAEVTFGWDRERAIGQQLDELLIPPAYREAHRAGMRRFLADGDGPVLGQTLELSGLRRDGTEFPVELTIWATRVGPQWSFNAFLRDVTESRRAADALARSNAELARSNADLEDFAAVAAHDLKSPLTTIGGFASMLEADAGGDLSEDGKTYAGFVVKGVRRMQTLVDDLLAYAQVGTNVESTRVPLTEVADEACALLARDIRDTAAVVSLHDLPAVLGDAGQLRQLFSNLIGNAVKFRRPQTAPIIHIGAERTRDRWEITVSDHGIGIDAQAREQVFKMFQRLNNAADYPGTGIGLAICRRVVENHGGHITIDGAPDWGTQFRFDLPAADG